MAFEVVTATHADSYRSTQVDKGIIMSLPASNDMHFAIAHYKGLVQNYCNFLYKMRFLALSRNALVVFSTSNQCV